MATFMAFCSLYCFKFYFSRQCEDRVSFSRCFYLLTYSYGEVVNYVTPVEYLIFIRVSSVHKALKMPVENKLMPLFVRTYDVLTCEQLKT